MQWKAELQEMLSYLPQNALWIVEFLPKKGLPHCGDYSGKAAFQEEAMMPVQTSETRASVVAFGPKKGRPDSTVITDDAGQHVLPWCRRLPIWLRPIASEL